MDLIIEYDYKMIKNLYNNKYWSPVSRIDNVYGDRNLFCTCPPVDEYDNIENTG